MNAIMNYDVLEIDLPVQHFVMPLDRFQTCHTALSDL